jgi:hypothetical protein
MPPSFRSWREQLPGAFAFQTAPFASHPLDERRAVAMFHAALRAGATEDDIIAAAVAYLTDQHSPMDEIERQISRIRSFTPRPSSKVRSARAWLVTLESTDKPPQVVSVFKAQRSADFVREYMEQYYIDTYYSVQEKLLYAQSRKNNPYPATFEKLNGVPWQGRITCGHNPFLYGRLVQKLRVLSAPDGNVLTWEESPIPTLPADK